MSTPVADVSGRVDYTTDKWLVDRVPWALWFAAGGLAIVLHASSRGGYGALIAIGYLALLGVVFAGFALSSVIERSGLPIYIVIPAGLLLVVAVSLVVVLATGTVGRSSAPGFVWTSMVKPPANVFGWMAIYLGVGWSAFAVYRHFNPGRPIVMLTPAGVAFHRSWLKDVFIPWQEVRGVGPLDISDGGSVPAINPNAIVVLVDDDFYERHIAPKRSFLPPPGSELMFRPQGQLIQMVLSSTEIVAAPEEFRGPIAARWQAFKDRPPASVPAAGGMGVASTVVGRWAVDGSRWQLGTFLAPFVGMAAIVLHRIAGA